MTAGLKLKRTRFSPGTDIYRREQLRPPGYLSCSSLRVPQTEPYFLQAAESLRLMLNENSCIDVNNLFLLSFQYLGLGCPSCSTYSFTHPDPLPNILFQYKSDLKVIVLNSILNYYTIKNLFNLHIFYRFCLLSYHGSSLDCQINKQWC